MTFNYISENNSRYLFAFLLIMTCLPTVDSFSDVSIGLDCQLDEQKPPPDGFIYKLDSCPYEINFNPSTYCFIPDMDICMESTCPGFCLPSQARFDHCTIQYKCIWTLEEKTSTTSTLEPKTTTLEPKTTTPKPQSSSLSSTIISIIFISVFGIVFIVACIAFFLYKKFTAHPHQNLPNVNFRNSSAEFIAMDQLDGHGSENLNPA